MAFPKEDDLNTVLRKLGYTTNKVGHYRKNILKDGKVVFTGTANDVWHWLLDPKEKTREVK